MGLQEALEKVEEYNAAIELPSSGLLGLAAFEASPREAEIAKAELKRCLDICLTARKTMMKDIGAVRGNIYLYSALAAIFQRPEDRRRFETLLNDIRATFEVLIKRLEGQRTPRVPSKKRLDDISKRLHALTEDIRRTIPRNTYLASLGSRIHSGLPTR